MQKYKSHKVVEAAQISAAEFNADGSGRVAIVGDGPTIDRMFEVPSGFIRPNTAPVMNPDGGDYLVRYEGGYLSWSPKAVFEAGYTPVAPEPAGEHSYRKKPVVVQAFQMTRERRASNADWPAWMHEAWNAPKGVPGSLFPSNYPDSDGTDQLQISTLEGQHLVSWGDYIIQGVKGELYPCKPDIFEATYDRADVAPEPDAGKFMLFVGESYYARGGWNDFKGAFATLDEAAAAGKALVEPNGLDDWWHVVDLATGKAVLGTDGEYCGSLPKGAAAAS